MAKDSLATMLKANKTYSSVLPESFDPGEFLNLPKLRPRADDACYFMGLILIKRARGQADETGVVRLRAGYLRNVMHQRDAKRVVDALLEGGAVRRSPYKVGERSFGYRLSDRFIDDRHVRHPITDTALIRRLESFHAIADHERKLRMKPVHFALERQQYRLRIHGDQAREIIAGLPPKSNPFDVQGVLVADIEHGDFHCNVGQYGRFTNNITSLKREVRSTLHVNGQRLTSVDISCCQPALIGQLAGEAKGKGTHGAGSEPDRGNHPSIYDAHSEGAAEGGLVSLGDLERYCAAVQAGTFYELMVAELSAKGIGREELKRRFLADVVAKKKANKYGAEYPSDIENTFRRLFPSVYGFIRRVNHDGWEHCNLIHQLQRAESKLVIETVAADLVTRFPEMFLITLHDAIYTTEQHLPQVVEAFHRAFDQTGFPMTLKIGS